MATSLPSTPSPSARSRSPSLPRASRSRSRPTTSIESKLGSEVESVPFCVALAKDTGIYANAEKIHNLKQFGKTIKFCDFDQIGNCIKREAKLFAKKFYPDDECLTSYEVIDVFGQTPSLKLCVKTLCDDVFYFVTSSAQRASKR